MCCFVGGNRCTYFFCAGNSEDTETVLGTTTLGISFDFWDNKPPEVLRSILDKFLRQLNVIYRINILYDQY